MWNMGRVWRGGGGESNLEKHCGFLKRKEKVHFPPSRKDEGILSGNLNHNLALNNKLKNIFTPSFYLKNLSNL
jgi:hypothetical protein